MMCAWSFERRTESEAIPGALWGQLRRSDGVMDDRRRKDETRGKALMGSAGLKVPESTAQPMHLLWLATIDLARGADYRSSGGKHQLALSWSACRLAAGHFFLGIGERMNPLTLARAHGVANLVGGLWPLLHLHSFEAVFGPKTDRWLVKTVSGLLIVNGLTQLRTTASLENIAQARRLGVGTAAVLAVIDLIYVPAVRISKMYLIDAAVEIGWIMAWLTSEPASS
jgi:hypothetical protein